MVNEIKNSYRPEIDGLRCVAVLFVLLYHAQFEIFDYSLFQGGYIGVDIFFVISGYLISRLLIKEINQYGKINFIKFYERRARRILPILFVVILVSIPFAYKILLPNQLTEFAQSTISAILFSSNIFFYLTNTQYGAEDSLLQPLIHTWSLGVEEQFYILFPLILIILYKCCKYKNNLMILILVLMSLGFAEWQNKTNPMFNFFLIFGRFWELGIGYLIADYEIKQGKIKNELISNLFLLFGLLLIFLSLLLFNKTTSHPGVITFIPVLGSVLIILSNVQKKILIKKIITNKIVVGLGLISYSLYLWHYPILALARNHYVDLGNIEKIFLLLLTLVLSIISFYLIEKPFRNKDKLSTKKITIILSLLFIFIIGSSITIINKNNKTNEVKFLMDERNNYRLTICGADNSKCIKRNKILFIGDSMVMDGLNIILSQGKINYEFNTIGGCPPIDNFELLGKSHPYRDDCIKLNNERFKSNYSEYDGIVIINRYAWINSLDIEGFLKYLKNSNFKNVLLIGDGYSINKNFIEIINSKNYDFKRDIKNKIIKGLPDKEFKYLAEKYNYKFISLNKTINSLLTQMEKNNSRNPIIIDQHHLSLETAQAVGKENKNKILNFIRSDKPNSKN